MANVNVLTSGFLPNIEGGNRVSVRTSSNRVYVLQTQGEPSNGIAVRKGNQDGTPTSFTFATASLTVAQIQEIGVACAIDSNDIIHCIYYEIDTGMNGIIALRYVTFDTSTDTFGTPESVATLDNDDATHTRLAIAIDANDKPHVTWADALTTMGSTTWTIWYSNKISGSWRSRVSVKSQSTSITGHTQEIIIGEPTSAIGEDRPIVFTQSVNPFGDSRIDAYYGTALDATGFIEQADVTGTISVNNNAGDMSAGIDSNGKITIAFVEQTTLDLMVVEHLASSAWSSWQTPSDVSTARDYTTPSIAISGTDRVIISESTTNDDLYGFVDTGSGFSEISAGDLPNVGTFRDVKVKWANYWNKKLIYYFDASDTTIDNGTADTNPSNYYDGSDTTFGSLGGNGQANGYEIHGTNAPASGDTIKSVSCRLTHQEATGSERLTIKVYIDGQGETLADKTYTNTTKTRSAFPLSVPTGGWTWAKLQALEVEIFAFAGTGADMDIYKIELAVSTDSDDIDYVFEDSSANVLYNVFTIISGSALVEVIADTIGLTEAKNIKKSIVKVIGDIVGLAESFNLGLRKNIADIVGLTENAFQFRKIFNISEILNLAEGFNLGHRKNIGDTVGLVENQNRLGNLVRNIPDTVGLTEVFDRIRGLIRNIPDTVGLTEGFNRLGGLIRNIPDTIGLTEAKNRALGLVRNIPETVGLVEGFNRLGVLIRNIPDTIGLTEGFNRLGTLIRNIPEVVGLVEAFNHIILSGIVKVVDDIVGLVENQNNVKGLVRTIDDTLGITEGFNRLGGLIRNINDIVGLTEGFNRLRNMVRNIADTVNLTEATNKTMILVRNTADVVGLTEAFNKIRGLTRVANDTVGLVEAFNSQLFAALVKVVNDTVGLVEAFNRQLFAAIVKVVNDTVGLTEGFNRLGGLVRNINDTIGITQAFNSLRGLVRNISDTMGITEGFNTARNLVRNISDIIGLSEGIVRARSLVRNIADTVGLTELFNIKKIGAASRKRIKRVFARGFSRNG